MDDDASSSPAASYIRLVQHLIEKCICYKLNKEECMETLEKHAKIMPVITSTVWKELEKENREFFETYKKDRGGGPNLSPSPSPNQEEAAAGPGPGHRHPCRVQQSGCSQEQESSTTLQKNASVSVQQEEQRVVLVVDKESCRKKNPSSDEQERRVMVEKQENNPCVSKSSASDKDK